MLTKDAAEPRRQASPLDDAKAGAEIPPLNPQDPIEVGSQGSGTVNDPSATDTKPPGFADLEPLA